MDIQIIEHAADASVRFYSDNLMSDLMGQDMREFRIDTTSGAAAWALRIVVSEMVISAEKVRLADYYEDEDASIEEIYLETGRLHTQLEGGAVVQITEDAISVFLPVHDGFADKETHWVAAVPVLRKLLVH